MDEAGRRVLLLLLGHGLLWRLLLLPWYVHTRAAAEAAAGGRREEAAIRRRRLKCGGRGESCGRCHADQTAE